MRVPALWLAGLCWLAAGTGGPAAAQELAATIMSGLAALPDRQAAFTDNKVLAALAAPVRSSGVLVFRHPDHLEKRTVSPRAETLVIERNTLTIAEGGKPARVIDLADQPALAGLAATMTATLAGDLPALRRVFEVRASGAPLAWRMVLIPADPELRRFLASITLDGAAADLRQLAIVQANGDTETMLVQPLR